MSGVIFDEAPTEIIEHVLEFGGTAGTDKPLTVIVEPMSAAEYAALERQTLGLLPRGSRKAPNYLEQHARLRDRVLRARVKGLKNFRVRKADKTVVEVTTIAELLASPGVPAGVLDEIAEVITNASVLTETELGKSEQPSASS